MNFFKGLPVEVVKPKDKVVATTEEAPASGKH